MSGDFQIVSLISDKKFNSLLLYLALTIMDLITNGDLIILNYSKLFFYINYIFTTDDVTVSRVKINCKTHALIANIAIKISK